MQKLHQKLIQKYQTYNTWHQTKHHNKIHWGVLAGFTLLIFGTILRWTPISLAADIAAPTTPATLTATPISSSQINLSWTASADDVGVAGYKIYRCAGSSCTPTAQIATSATNSYSDTGLTASTAYTYAVSAHDAAGNESGKSALASATTLAQTGNVYYVDQSHYQALDTNPGTEELPWLTIQKAAQALQAGDTVLVKGGTYNVGQSSAWDRPAVYPANNGQPGNPIIFKAYPGETVYIQTLGGQDGAIGTFFNQYIVWDGFTVQMRGVQLKGIMIGNSSNVEIRNCTIEGNDITNEPVLPHNHDNHDGIRIDGSNTILVTDCIIKDVIVKPNYVNSAGIKMYTNINVTIEHNEIFNNSVGIFDKSRGSSGTIIRRNLIHDNGGSLSTLQSPWQSPKVYENIFVNGAVDYDTDAYSDSEQFYNNVIYFSQTHGEAAFVPRGGTSPTTNFQFWNNIIYDAGRHIAHRCNPQCVQINYHDYNGYYPKFDIAVNEYGHNPQRYSAISAWQAAGWDINGWVQDPKFVDLANWDFHLRSDSPAKRSGRNGEDIGAYPRDDATVIGPRATAPPPPDTQSPTTPTNLSATPTSSTQINLSWIASTDDVGVTGYKIYRCAGSACAPTVQIATSATNSYSNTGLTASTAYTYAVSAYDAAGNESEQSAPVSATTQAQTDNIYYVDQNHPEASDTNPGTEALPWKTIQKAADTLIAGDRVLVRAGLYSMQGELGSVYSQYGIYPKNSGISGSPIIYKVYPGENVIIDQGNKYAGFLIANKSNITISGFEIQNLYGSGVGTHDNTSYITVENNVIHDANAPAGANIGAIGFNFCSRCVARNNKLYNVSVNGDMRSQNASAIGSNYDMEYAIIENNEMWNAGNGVFHKRSTGRKGAIIRNNIIRNVYYCVRYSVSGVGDPPHIDQEVYNNICYDSPIGIYASTWETKSPSTGLLVYNNVFVTPIVGIGIHGYKDVKIWNNIFFEGGTNYYYGAIATVGEPAINSISLSNYNAFYPPAKFILNTYSSSEIAYNTLSAWQSGTGFDLNSLNSDPLFVDVLERNYHLQSDSPGINAGIDRQDYDGDGDTAERINMGAYITGNEVIGVIGIRGIQPSSDTQSPTTATNLTATAISSSQINLSWSASTDNVGVTGYKIYRCAGSACAPTTQIATSPTNSYPDTGLTTSTAYTYAVSAYDAAGNESGKSGSASATTLSQFKPSDLNQDRKVDQLDFDILKQDWNRTDKPVSDLNQDGVVDSRDLGIMMSEWTR